MAHLKQKKDCWYLVESKNRKEKWIRLGKISKLNAKKVLARYEIDETYLRLGNLGDEPILLDELIDEYFEHIQKHKSASTIKWESWTLQELKKVFPERLASSITTKEIEALLFKKEYSPAYIRGRVVILRNLFKHAVDVGYLGENVAKKCKLPRLEITPPEILPDSVIDEICSRATGVFKIQLDILRYTGCRPSECIKLKAKDLDFEKKEILFRHTKTKKSRFVPMSSKIINAIKEYAIKKRPEEYLFPEETRHTLRLKLMRLIPKEYPHRVFLYAFRRYAASKLLDVTMGDLRLVSQLLGHSQIQTTLRYAMRPQEALKKAVDLL